MSRRRDHFLCGTDGSSKKLEDVLPTVINIWPYVAKGNKVGHLDLCHSIENVKDAKILLCIYHLAVKNIDWELQDLN